MTATMWSSLSSMKTSAAIAATSSRSSTTLPQRALGWPAKAPPKGLSRQSRRTRMPWTMQHVEGSQILVIGYQGKITAEELLEANQKAMGHLVGRTINKVLVDCSTARADMPILDVYKLPDLYVAGDMSRMIRVAMVLPKDGYKREIYEFYEAVCRNRGYQVQLFDDTDAAWQWLREAGRAP